MRPAPPIPSVRSRLVLKGQRFCRIPKFLRLGKISQSIESKLCLVSTWTPKPTSRDPSYTSRDPSDTSRDGHSNPPWAAPPKTWPPFPGGIFPNIHPEPPLAQLEAVPSCAGPVPCDQIPNPPWKSLKFPLDPPFLRDEPPQLPQDSPSPAAPAPLPSLAPLQLLQVPLSRSGTGSRSNPSNPVQDSHFPEQEEEFFSCVFLNDSRRNQGFSPFPCPNPPHLVTVKPPGPSSDPTFLSPHSRKVPGKVGGSKPEPRAASRWLQESWNCWDARRMSGGDNYASHGHEQLLQSVPEGQFGSSRDIIASGARRNPNPTVPASFPVYSGRTPNQENSRGEEVTPRGSISGKFVAIFNQLPLKTGRKNYLGSFRFPGGSEASTCPPLPSVWDGSLPILL
ncbi:vegetative cell wall protein gp1-like [Corvus kubaryi]|uniref:vegetative cell wall protein gp1-like n=1 Tax=Corvus kubaryi TaxID=68294 RepID=UPI001C04CA7F|nr:vegetative cell wall protein gp1-like [Corvus kubaryi]